LVSRALTFNGNAVAAANESAVSAYPEECCGFLYGSDLGDNVRVEAARAVENRQREKRAFANLQVSDLGPSVLHQAGVYFRGPGLDPAPQVLHVSVALLDEIV